MQVTVQYFFVSYTHQSCIYLVKNLVKTPILWKITIQNNYFLL